MVGIWAPAVEAGRTADGEDLGVQEVLACAGGLKAKSEELSVQERRQMMVKADRRERKQHKAEK